MSFVENKENLRELLDEWKSWDTVAFSPNFIDNIYNVKSGMLPKTKLPAINISDYKKIVYNHLALQERVSLPNFTDEEINNNFYVCDEYPTGIKLTKYVQNFLNKNKNLRFQRSYQELDYVNRPRFPNNEYFLDSTPEGIVKAYRRVETCVSPNGENSQNLFYFLASPYVYVAYGTNMRTRMLIYLDHEKKHAVLNRAYGEYDQMLTISVINYLISEGYSFFESFWAFGDCIDEFYVDGGTDVIDNLIKTMGGTFIKQKEYRNLLDRKSWMNFKGDLYTGDFCSHVITTCEGFRVTYDCGYCDNEVFEDNYIHELGACTDCAWPCECCHDYVIEGDSFIQEYCEACADNYREERRKELFEKLRIIRTANHKNWRLVK